MPKRGRLHGLALIPVFVIVAAGVLVGVVPFLIVWFLWGLVLGVVVRLRWIPDGRKALLVYSDSPHWKERFEGEILPHLGERVISLNWSTRSTWPRNPLKVSLAVWVFWRWKRRFEFNPMAIVFVPWWRPKVLRFWKPFKDLKHGKPERVTELEATLFDLLGDA